MQPRVYIKVFDSPPQNQTFISSQLLFSIPHTFLTLKLKGKYHLDINLNHWRLVTCRNTRLHPVLYIWLFCQQSASITVYQRIKVKGIIHVLYLIEYTIVMLICKLTSSSCITYYSCILFYHVYTCVYCCVVFPLRVIVSGNTNICLVSETLIIL